VNYSKKRAITPIKLKLFPLYDFPTENKLKSAVVSMVMSTKKGMRFGLIDRIPKRENSNPKV